MKKQAIYLTIIYSLTAILPVFSQSTVTVTGQPDHLEVAYNKTTVLLFPGNIRKVDCGSDDITAKTVKIGDNERILRVKANRDSIFVSNLHVFCDDGRIFTFEVLYSPNPAMLTRDMSTAAASYQVPATPAAAHMLPAQVRQYAAAIADMAPTTHRPRSSMSGMRMEMTGLYVYNGVLFFQFHLRNASGIPYDVDFTRFYIRDQKTTKRSTAMEKEVLPLYVYRPDGSSIDRNNGEVLVAAFDKFTISEKKLFMAEVFERNGDRHLQTGLKGKHLLRARPLTSLAGHLHKSIITPLSTVE